MAELFDNIQYIKGIGEKKAKCFEKLGVCTLYDLLSFFPRKYDDRSKLQQIAFTVNDEYACVEAVVATEPQLVRIRKGMELVKFSIADETGRANVTFFNQPYIRNYLHKGDEFVFYGRFEVKGTGRSLVNPLFESLDKDKSESVTRRIMPVYRLTSGLNQKTVVQSVKIALDSCAEFIPELIPEELLKKRQLAHARYAYENIHFPADFHALEVARKRLIYEELFALSLTLQKMRGDRVKDQGIKMHVPDMTPFFAGLNFEPTTAQHRAISEAIEDMRSGNAMSRLVQGDVGSGKTLVAAALIYFAYKNGYSSAFMVPTEILADQHFNNLQKQLCPLGLKVEKLTGSTKNKNAIKKRLADGDIDLIIGTHALISDDVNYAKLGLIVTDEQHRFGVEQRSALIKKGERPHVLVMSATPIPRTLSLIIYGELDCSVIDEMPPGRQTIDTFAVSSDYRQRLNAFIEKQCAEHHQVYVVCPMVEENEESSLNLVSAEEHTLELRKALPGLKIECVHGRMKPAEKDKIMSSFSRGEIDVLVSTTVIEVGVDVPNATLIIVENAERFGLSQLHQLRGRVGRGKDKSYCVLVSDSDGEDVKSRLSIMTKTNDGFKISEEDLRLRGPGDFFGNRQHGLPEMHIGSLGADAKVMDIAQQDAKDVLDSDPELKSYPDLRNRVQYILNNSNMTIN